MWAEMYGRPPNERSPPAAGTPPRGQWQYQPAPDPASAPPRNLSNTFQSLAVSPRRQPAPSTPYRRHGLVDEREEHRYASINSQASRDTTARPDSAVKTEDQLLVESEVIAAATVVDAAILELARRCREKAGLYSRSAQRMGGYLAEDVASYPSLVLHIGREIGTSSGYGTYDTVDGMYVIATQERNNLGESIARTVKQIVRRFRPVQVSLTDEHTGRAPRAVVRLRRSILRLFTCPCAE